MASKLPPEGAVLEGGEEGVEAGELLAVARLLPLDRLDRGGEGLLEGERGERDMKLPKDFQIDGNYSAVVTRAQARCRGDGESATVRRWCR